MTLNRGSEVFYVGREGPELAVRWTADQRQWIIRWLWERGVAPDQVVSVEAEPDGALAGVGLARRWAGSVRGPPRFAIFHLLASDPTAERPQSARAG
jgi:hypothetical protein